VAWLLRKPWKSKDDKADAPERYKFKHEIAESVQRLRRQIEKSLIATGPPVPQRLRFNGPMEAAKRSSVHLKELPSTPTPLVLYATCSGISVV
jgi:hypothetical protein